MGLCAGVAVSVAVNRRWQTHKASVLNGRPAADKPNCLVILAGTMGSSLNTVTRGQTPRDI
jgi:hypothetical protein